MGNDVAGATSGRSLEIFGTGVSSPQHFRKQKTISREASAENSNQGRAALHADLVAAERRAAALMLASIAY
jgi:hypothetical protein